MGRNNKIRTLRSPTLTSSLTGVNLHSGLDPANITLPANFTFHAVSKQDIWHPPEVPAGEEYDSPTYYVQYGPIHKFKSAQVSICGMSGTKQYDQAGLIFLVNSPGLEGEKYDSWIKTGSRLSTRMRRPRSWRLLRPGRVLGLEPRSHAQGRVY
ncbi:hypothetical protein RHS01_07433 [Rhizoctonia solani]|uniref:Uncharacterized protein n=1 Tax=Rhizoctonia solani TaxID=456999 RepID=A0A8H7I7F8_9AGAM|nr:hypothetical protein RHS01_07433 [Rhizoctonia solani]